MDGLPAPRYHTLQSRPAGLRPEHILWTLWSSILTSSDRRAQAGSNEAWLLVRQRVNLLSWHCITTGSAECEETLLCGSQSSKPGGSGLWHRPAAEQTDLPSQIMASLSIVPMASAQHWAAQPG